ncbi:MAG: hypothetical protein P9L99_09290 [Candidatus Lernaella stagnicola]|nr:hypothetical protein [Candidatus Lernaella stagnicola]
MTDDPRPPLSTSAAARGALVLSLLILVFWLPMMTPGRIFDNRDDVFIHLFFQAFVDHALTVDHALPLWSHHLGGGFALFADPDFPFPDPFVIAAAFVFDDLLGFKMVLLLWLMLGGLSAYWFVLRVLGVSRTVAVGTALAAVCSPWAVRRLAVGGDTNDVSAFLFLFFLAGFHFMTHRVMTEPEAGGSWRGIHRRLRWGRVFWATSFLTLMVGAALASGKAHLFVFAVMVCFYAAGEALPLAWRRDRRALVPLGVAAATLALPLLLFHGRLFSTFRLSKRLFGSLDFSYKLDRVSDLIPQALVDEVLREQFPSLGFALVLAGAALGFAVYRRRFWVLPAMAALAALLMLGETTHLGEWFYSLPIARTTASYKYYSFYLSAPLVLLAGAAVDRLRRGKWKWAVSSIGLVLVLLYSGSAWLLLIRHTRQVVEPTPAAGGFFNIENRHMPANPYYLFRSNLGTTQWENPFRLPSSVEPRYFLAEDQQTFVPQPARFEPNPEYRGEAYFQGDANRVSAVRRATNRISVDVDVAQQPALLILNMNFHRSWRSNVGVPHVREHRLALAKLPAGKYTIELRFKPRKYVIRAAIDLAVFGVLLIFVIGGAIVAGYRWLTEEAENVRRRRETGDKES